MTATASDLRVLDNAAWHALHGAHAGFAVGGDVAIGYDREVSVFHAIADDEPASWEALGGTTAPDGTVVLFRAIPTNAPATWELLFSGPGVQFVLADPDTVDGPPAGAIRDVGGGAVLRPLGPRDVPAMTALVRATEPGPFAPRTIDLGGYVGIFHGDRLVAMAGQRLRPPGCCEISAVCTAPEARRRGYASILTAEVARGIVARGEVPFLHIAASNTPARSVYEQLGFVARTDVSFGVYRPG